MKNHKSLIASAVCAVTALSAVPFTAGAADDIVYGTMNIPYADFYANEGIGYEVDAVSSATTSKWSKNGVGELFEGTYNQANDDGTGTILGVTFPVAVSQADLDALGENNYGFSELEETPAIFKNVTVTDGKAQFSEVQDSEIITSPEASVKLNTNTPWGDYLIDVENNTEMGAIYGAIIRTFDGNSYAMCHEANIWRGELAWSSGIKKTEPHGNTLPYKDYINLMGATISEIDFITLDGYFIVPTNTYVPIKFENEITIANSKSGSGTAAITISGIPEDYNKSYKVEGMTASINDSQIVYTDALAGSYTLTISDADGKYADVYASFTLTTDSMPAAYSDGKIVKTENADDADFANFMKNISKVTVNGTEYASTGRGSVKIINEDGSIDFNASSRDGSIFDGSRNYELIVEANGYTHTLEFSINDNKKPDDKGDDNKNPDEKDDNSNYLMGDINSDGYINALDASIVLTEYANIATGKSSSFSSTQKAAADVNKDGNTDALDASKILTYYAATATGSEPSWN